MTDAEAEALAADIESRVPPAPHSVQLQLGKPEVVVIRGTSAGLRRLAAAILRCSIDERPASTTGRGADRSVLEHLTRHWDALDALVHPASALRILGVGAFEALPDIAVTPPRSVREWAVTLALVVGLGIACVAMVTGLVVMFHWVTGP